jgi:hypothetical protein
MPKVFLSSIGLYKLGPMGSAPKNQDAKKWNARKSVSISLKDLFYFAHIAKLKAAGSLSYSTSRNFEVGCGGDQYCKSNTSSTSNTKYSVQEAKDFKISSCAERNPKCNTKEVTTLELMFYFFNNSWVSKIESEYRVTNAEGNCPTGPEIKNCSNKQRNCCQDVRYDWNGEKWVRTTLSSNPDTTFSDYTYKVDSSIGITIGRGGYLDDSNYIVQDFAYFAGNYLYLDYPSDQNPTTCEKFTGKGTLTAIGKFINSYLYGQPCGGQQDRGIAFLSTTWSSNSKLNLMPP